MIRSVMFSKKRTLWVFLYSLLFLAAVIPYPHPHPNIVFLCLSAVIPFTGGAWIAGMAAVSAFKTNYAFLPAAWLAVFVQAYFVALVVAAFRERKDSKKQKEAGP